LFKFIIIKDREDGYPTPLPPPPKKKKTEWQSGVKKQNNPAKRNYELPKVKETPKLIAKN
jgi:hypothetical protein